LAPTVTATDGHRAYHQLFQYFVLCNESNFSTEDSCTYFLGSTRSIERNSYGNVAGWLGGCPSQPVLYQND